ncbi:MAG: radical SAM/Cys-rich domain protein [bacterium]|nr:radical SAM/Cys-rich domain protein [bacterium]
MTRPFERLLEKRGLLPLCRGITTTLQVNVGLRCDLACRHCHVEAGPKREEALGRKLAEQVLRVLAANPQLDTLDLTGGAPELNPLFRELVRGARRLGRRVIDRCNLTVLFAPGQEDTPEFLAGEEVDIVASLPCFSAENVDAQRGKLVFERSIAALKRLNALGYASGDGRRNLDLVYNPLGASLPPPQATLEAEYRRELWEFFDIRFDGLLTITNVPIKRFARALERRGELDAYLALLVQNFNPATVPRLMCRSTLSVRWNGSLYDCDFNQARGLPLAGPKTLFDLEHLRELEELEIATSDHCLACTAGSGSSCGGALA